MWLVGCGKGTEYTNLFHSENKDHMPSRHRLEKKLPHEIDIHEIDIKEIAVALAFLVGIGVFALGRDDPRVSEDRRSPSVSMQIAPILTTERNETLPQPDGDLTLSDTSRRLNAFR